MKQESVDALGAVDLGVIELPGHMLHGPLEQFRRSFPVTVGKMAEIVVDNPGQIGLVTAGSMVAAQIALNLMKPRTPAQALALFIVLQVGLSKAAWAAVQKGWITFRVRDHEGKLIPLVIGKTEA